MDKNMKIIFLFTTLLILLMAVTTATAADVDNTTKIEKVGTTSVAQEQTPVKEITKVDKKTTKKESKIDYYVSNEGDDANTGTQENPFKTMQTAINKTTQENEYTIHIAEGIYKGEGNLNLTVPGSNNINFIGSGVNKTIFDGEAKFTIPDSGNEAWGGSAFWNNWYNCSGNWFMNITSGEGQFNISDMTIQNCWSNGGSAIELNPTATIDNYATLNATNVYFDSNHAGNGAGIRNNNGGTLYVDNCTFTNGTKAQSTGNLGAAIYNNGTAVITDTTIVNNYARWGSVTNDRNITLINCTFRDNKAYDARSLYKKGPSFAADTGIIDINRKYAVLNLTSTIINCTFENNQQADITNGRGDLIVDNCIFNHSTGVYLFNNSYAPITNLPTMYVTNNQFIDIQPTSLFSALGSRIEPSVAIMSFSQYNLTIENNVIDVPDLVNGIGINITNNTIVKNNTINNYININGVNNTIINNTINTKKNSTIELTRISKNAKIINNTLISAYNVGDLAIMNPLSDTIMENNQPTADTFEINDDNYDTYFDENGVLKNDVIPSGSMITFKGPLTNKDFIFDNTGLYINVTTTLINSTITTRNNASVYFNNLKINSTGNDKGYVILFDSNNNFLKSATINIVTDKVFQGIIIDGNQTMVDTLKLNMTAAAGDVEWYDGYTWGLSPTTGVLVRSSNNYFKSSNIYVYGDTKDPESNYPTVDGMDIVSKKPGEYITGNTLYITRINVTGGDNVYGLNMIRANDTYSSLSYFDVTSTSYAVGVQQGDSDNNRIAGYIYAKADSIAYGFYSTAMATGISKNTNLSKLYISKLEASTATGISMEGVVNTIIADVASYTISGNTVKAIEFKKDYLENPAENVTISKLTIELNGQSESSSVMTFEGVPNVYINSTNIKLNNGTGITLTDSPGAIIENNYLIAGTVGGNSAVKSNLEDSIIRNNTPATILLTDETYPDYFDENGMIKVDADLIILGGDLHDKDIKLDASLKMYNITNIGDYTIYNGTIVFYGNTATSTGPNKIFRITGVNFDNTNKPVFKDEINGTKQTSLYFTGANIKATGDDIVLFEAYNNNSYLTLDVSTSNINAEAKNVKVIDYSGFTTRTTLLVHDNIINANAEETSIIINALNATAQLNKNNITQKAKTILTANYTTSAISSYNFRYNKIDLEGDDVQVLNFIKIDTSSAYIDSNNITIKAKNPVVAINITNKQGANVQNNKIIAKVDNGDTPLVYSNQKTGVRNNYLETRSLMGNAAVTSTGTVSGNTPDTTGRNVTIIVENTTWNVYEESTVTFNITNLVDEEVTGTVTATIDGEEVQVVDKTITYTPTTPGEVQITIKYVDPEGTYKTTTQTVKIPVTIPESETNITTENPVVGETTNLTASFYTEEGLPITSGKAIFRVNGKTLRNDQGEVIYVDVVNGKAVLSDVNITGEWMKPDTTIQAIYTGNDEFEPIFTEETTVNVAKPEATVTLNAPTEATAGQEINLKATVTDGDKLVNSGRIAFKFNGKTLKDENGKAIYANVKDGIATTTYKIPAKTKAKSYTLTAVFIDDTYERVEATQEIVISKA